MKKKYLILLSISSGALLGLSFPPLSFTLLAFIGFTPLLFLREEHPRGNFWYYYFAFFVYNAITNWWIGSWQPESDPYLMAAGVLLIFIHPFFFTIPMLVYSFLRNKLPGSTGIWSFPFVWVVFEWWRTMGDMAYPWLSVGYSQTENLSWIQFADISGIWGISFFISIINVLFLKYVLTMRKERIKAASSGGSIQPFIVFKKPVVYYVSAGLLIFIVPSIYGYFKLNEYKHKELISKHESVKIGLIQPDINPWLKWQSHPLTQIRRHFEMSDSLNKTDGNLDLIVWSETAVTYLGTEFNTLENINFFTDRLNNLGVPLLTGFSEMRIFKNGETPEVTAKRLPGGSSRFYQSYNSALLLHPDSMNMQKQVYRKMKLTPFSERFPCVELVPFAKKWFEWGVGISSWGKGKELKNLSLLKNGDTVKISPVICIESVFPRHVSRFSEKGGGVIVIITNDAWYNHTFGPEQHNSIAVIRAVENRRYIARCANSGVSGFISPLGKTIKRADVYEPRAIASAVPVLKKKTLYALYGDWLPLLCTIYIALSFFYVILRKFAKN